MFETARRRVRLGGLGMGLLAIVTWQVDAIEVAFGLIAVAAVVLLVDAKLTETDLISWGDD